MNMEHDDELLKRINRQLRGIKWLLGFFALLIVALFIILAFIAYRVVTFTNHVNTKIDTLQRTTVQKLDVKSQLCGNISDAYIKQQVCE